MNRFRPALLSALLAVPLLVSACGTATDGGGDGDGDSPPTDALRRDPFRADPLFLDQLLAWEGPRHGTFGSTGKRLFVDRHDSTPGITGTFCYIHHTPGLTDLIRLTFEDPERGPLAPDPFAETWRPSFHEKRYALGPYAVVERAFLADEDVAVSIAEIRNTGATTGVLQVGVSGGFASDPVLDQRHLRPIDIGLFTNLGPPASGDASGILRVAGVPFVLRDPRLGAGENSAVALRGGREGDPEFERPENVEIPINLHARNLHILGQIGLGDGAVPDGTVVARYRLIYDDGVKSRDLRMGKEFARAGAAEPPPYVRGGHGAFVLTLPVDSARRLRYLRFEKVATSLSPALFAVTAEDAVSALGGAALGGEDTFFGVHTAARLAARFDDGGKEARSLNVSDWDRARLQLQGSLRLEPGAAATLRIAHAFAGTPEEAQSRAEAWLSGADPLARHRAAYHAWFDANCPRFACGDPLLDTLWWYRWFVVRHNLAEPAAGNLQVPVFYEGRHGSWYPRLISFSSPHIIAETRWLRDPRWAQDQVRAHLATADEEGVIQSALVDWKGAFYTHWIAQAAWELHAVHPDRAFLAEVAPGLARDVLATAARFDPDGDALPAPPSHYATGMEFQPSFFYFAGFDDTQPEARLERPEFAAYLCANAGATAAALDLLGDAATAARLREVEAATREALLNTLWDGESGLFLSAREEDDVLVPVPEIVAFYPWRFGLVPDAPRYARAFDLLFSPADFATPVPFATCSRRVPAFSPQVQTWPAPGGLTTPCMWNGPVWPHADSVIAGALGETLANHAGGAGGAGGRAHGLDAARFREFLLAYARFQFESGDPRRPMLREYGDAETGVQWGCPDYFHSTWIDLVERYGDLAGLPRPWFPADP